jgi:hypothetical protein
MTKQAQFERTDTGVVPADAGWFIANLADLRWETLSGGGTWKVKSIGCAPGTTCIARLGPHTSRSAPAMSHARC